MVKVSNEDVIEAMGNEEYQKIMARASKKFFKILNVDEIECCKLNALWKALLKYDENAVSKSGRTPKFTSFLYRGVELECKTASKFVATGRKPQGTLHENIGVDSSFIDAIDMRDEMMRIDHGDIIDDIYYEGMTIKEIAANRGVSTQIISLRKKRALKSLKLRLE